MIFQFRTFHNPDNSRLPYRKTGIVSFRAMVFFALCIALPSLERIAVGESGDPDTVRLMTFNIRMNTPTDGKNAWPNRKDMVVSVIRDFKPDFLGIQEAKPEQVAFLRAALSEYGVLSRSREKNANEGEACSVFYRKDRWRIDPDEQGTYWLSDTPDEPASITWGNACTRIVTWGRFTEIGKRRDLYFINTHFDHRSSGARKKSAALLRKRIAKLPESIPVLLVGDFNAAETAESMEILKGKPDDESFRLVDTFRVVHPSAERVGTFNGFAGRDTGSKIDHIFLRGRAKVLDAAIIKTQRERRYPSDHFPVTATLRLPPK